MDFCVIHYCVSVIDCIHWLGPRSLGMVPPFFLLRSCLPLSLTLHLYYLGPPKGIILRCSFPWRPPEKAETSVAERPLGPWHSHRISSHGWPADACPRPATEPPWQGCSAASGKRFTPIPTSQPRRYGELGVGETGSRQGGTVGRGEGGPARRSHSHCPLPKGGSPGGSGIRCGHLRSAVCGRMWVQQELGLPHLGQTGLAPEGK